MFRKRPTISTLGNLLFSSDNVTWVPRYFFSVRRVARSRAMHASTSNCLIAARPRALRRAPLTLMHLPRASAVATGLDGAISTTGGLYRSHLASRRLHRLSDRAHARRATHAPAGWACGGPRRASGRGEVI